MTFMKRLVSTAAAIALGTLLSVPSFAARSVSGTVGNVDATDAGALGSVGFRIYSALPGGETNFNENTSSCQNVRCLRSYDTNATLNPGGYIGNIEATQVYNSDIQSQPYYMLADADMNDVAANHIAFWGVSGVTGDNSGKGLFLAAGCPSTTATNCFIRLDSTLARPPLTGTSVTFGGAPGTIRAIGGLNPIPNVRIDSVSFNVVQLSWLDPPTYAGAMHPGTVAPAPPSPVKGVRLWKNERLGTCTDPTGSDPGWTSIGVFNLGNSTTSVNFNAGAACTYFALTVRVIGPGGGSLELETGQQGSTHFVGVNSFPVYGCDDGNPCTDDGFNAPSTCNHTNNTTACNDGNPCTVNDICGGGSCSGTLSPDTDGDGVRNACDNCPTVSNSNQTNSDGDSRGNACDNCPLVPNSNQADLDGDGVGDLCDNCLTLINSSQVDSDQDGAGNACDNCPLTPNQNQADIDSDAIGDICDDCPLDYNPSQADQDGEGVGDACDNCLSVRNADQADSDHDAEGDLCDTNDGQLFFTQVTKGRLDWQHESVYARFNLYRGSLERLLATGEYTQNPGTEPEAAHFCDLLAFTQLDARLPPLGRANLYLVTGEGAGGAESSLGMRSNGSPRQNAHPCP